MSRESQGSANFAFSQLPIWAIHPYSTVINGIFAMLNAQN